MTGRDRSSADAIYRCTADPRRRYIVSYLRTDADGTATYDELVDHVVERERNSPAPDPKTVLIDVRHRHLPMLADVGVLEFDDRTETVRYRGNSSVESLLDAGPQSRSQADEGREENQGDEGDEGCEKDDGDERGEWDEEDE